MATFTLSNAAGRGFDMSMTSGSGFAFVEANPNITETLVYDQNGTAIWETAQPSPSAAISIAR